jgi:hypothetical protein
MTKVVNIRKQTIYDVYIGRAGKGQDGYFGNPVAVGKTCPECKAIHMKGGSTLKCYRSYMMRRISTDPEFLQRLQELKDKTLACFCVGKEWKVGDKGDLVCHGQVIALFLDSDESQQ